MKKLVIACVLLLTHISHAHSTQNPYYDFIKEESTPLTDALSFSEKIECLRFFSGQTIVPQEWLEKLSTYVEYLYSRFMQAYEACIQGGTITPKMQHFDEFITHVSTGLYRVIYEQTIDSNDPFCLEYAHAIPLPTPDDVDQACADVYCNK